jgi:hypothetical protein
LLEPNNFIPSWEAGDEEMKEVSKALRKLRQKYDEIYRLAQKKQADLKQLQVSTLTANFHRKMFKPQKKKSRGSRVTRVEPTQTWKWLLSS